MAKGSMDLVQGTLDMLVLKALNQGPQHGYSVMRWIRETSDEELQIEEGALYPALHRMEERGLVDAEWGLSENNRRAKFYRLTAKGRRRFDTDAAVWTRYVKAVAKILQTV